jgi:hypothetical protein
VRSRLPVVRAAVDAGRDLTRIRNPQGLASPEASDTCVSCHHRGTPAVWEGTARDLPGGSDPGGPQAVQMFVCRIGREIGPMAAALHGVDSLVFTGGIGENADIRARVCADAAWLGVELDAPANALGGPRLSTGGSRVSVWVIPTHDEALVAQHTRRVACAP